MPRPSRLSSRTRYRSALRNNLASALTFTGGDLREQVEFLEDAVADAPEDANGWTNLTHANRASMNLPRALEAGALAVRPAPTSALAHNNYALALREAQRWDDAAQAGARLHTRSRRRDHAREPRHAASHAWPLRRRLAAA